MIPQEITAHLPKNADQFLVQWIKDYPVEIYLKRARKTKLGDYQQRHGKHYISVNQGLDIYLTFFILTHEIAHLHAREKFGRKIQPHGKEWKNVFADLIYQTLHIYPAELQHILKKFAQNPRANFYAYAPLVKYFHHSEEKRAILLKDVPMGQKFRLRNKIYRKGQLRKIRYLCKELSTGKMYTIHSLAPIEEIFEE